MSAVPRLTSGRTTGRQNGGRPPPTPSPLRRMEVGASVLTVLPPGASPTLLSVMPPPPPSRKPSQVGKKRVLEEETFVDAIEGIIGRDFFPELPMLKRQLRWLEAVTITKDGRGVVSATDVAAVKNAILSEQRKVGSTPLPSPLRSDKDGMSFGNGSSSHSGSSGGGGVAEMENDLEEESSFAKINTDGMSLSDFQRMHTSEDNESFQKILEGDQAKKRKLYWWANDGAVEAIGGDPTKPQLYVLPSGALMTAAGRAIMDKALATSVEKAGYDQRPQELETWKHRVRNQLHFQPDMQVSNDTCKIGYSEEGSSNMLKITAQGEKNDNKASVAPALAARGGGEGGAAEQMNMRRRVEQIEAGEKEEAAAGGGAKRRKRGDGGAGEDGNAHGTAVVSTSEADAMIGTAGNGNTNSSSSKNAGSYAIVEAPLYTKMAGQGILKNAKVIQHKSTRLSGAFLQEQRKTALSALGLLPPEPRASVSSGSGGASLGSQKTGTPSPLERPDSSRSSVMDLDDLEGVAGGADGRARGNVDVGGGDDVIMRRDYRPVEMTPLIEPGLHGDSPMMTWGQVEGTPMRIDPPRGGGNADLTPLLQGLRQMRDAFGGGSGDGDDDDAFKFRVKEQPRREALAHKLGAKKKGSSSFGIAGRGGGTKVGSSSSSNSRKTEAAKEALKARLTDQRAIRVNSPFGGTLAGRYSQSHNSQLRKSSVTGGSCSRSSSSSSNMNNRAGASTGGGGSGKSGGSGGSVGRIGITPVLTPRGIVGVSKTNVTRSSTKHAGGATTVNTDGLL